MSIPLPKPVVKFFSQFPLYTYPPISPPNHKKFARPTLWVHPPRVAEESTLSSDVECLKWQAYLALRGLTDIVIRCDVSNEGALDGRLPNLQIGEELLAAHMIPGWVDGRVGPIDSFLEGYKDEQAKDESRAWVSLMEGRVHAALVRVPLCVLSTSSQEPMNPS
jgi:metaxin